MRVLLDTNVLVTMLARRESIVRFKKLFGDSHTEHIASRYLLNEVERVLQTDLHLTKKKAHASTKLLARHSTIVTPRHIEPVVRDSFDDAILAAAVEGNVNYLVSTDKDLLVLEEYKSIRIITLDQWNAIVNNR